MKLLLTSGGITNQSMKNELFSLAGKQPEELSIAFIPTAANVEEGDKGWFVNDLVILKNFKPKILDIVDFSAVPRDIWQPRLEDADVLIFGGGNTFHLMYHLKKSGLAELLPRLLATRTYVGISAGSIVATHKLSVTQAQRLYSEEIGEYEGEDGLGFVNFHIRPHLNSPHFPKVRDEYLQQLAKEILETIYAIDDDTAISVVDGKMKVVTEGEYKIYNQA